tara:strand:- start:2651 stop:4150 length:1500 start_codon:yes stop_codon:yes gene_type:complete
MTYQNNIVTIDTNGQESTGYAFKSVCGVSKFVITSKHSICIDKPSCQKLSNGNNACRTCSLEVDNSKIQVKFENHDPIKVQDSFYSDSSDVAVIELDEEIEHLEYLNISFDSSDKYYIWNYNKDSLVLDNEREKYSSYYLYNVVSNASANFTSKDQIIPGYSGSPLFSVNSNDQTVIHAILTDDESNNDIGAEIITRDLIHELSLKSKVIINEHFSSITEGKDLWIMEDCFEFYYEYDLDHDNKVKIYSLPFSDSNRFDLNKIVDLLTNNITKCVYSPKEDEISQTSQMKVYKAFQRFDSEENDKYSKPALLQSIIESDLNAPTLYKSTRTDEFTSIHVRESKPEIFEFILTKNFSESNLIDSVKSCVDSLEQANTNISGSSLLLSHGFVDKNVSSKYADLISKLILPSNGIDMEFNFGLLSTYVFEIDQSVLRERSFSRKKEFIKRDIIKQVDKAIDTIVDMFEKNLFMGKIFYLYLIPINEVGELKKMMHEKIKDGE